MSSAGGNSVVVLSFAWLLAGLVVWPTTAANIGQIKFADHSISEQELETFASCSWPLDPLSLCSRFAAPKGALLLADVPVMSALVAFILLGVAAMYTDICEFAEAAERQHKLDKVVSRSSEKGKPRHPPTLRRLAFAFLALGLAIAWKAALPEPAAFVCQRSPLLTARHDPLTALPGQSLEEILHLADLQYLHSHPAVASDTTVIGFLLAVGLLGLAAAHSDVREMAAEKDREAAKTGLAGKKAASSCSSRDGTRSSLWSLSIVLLIVGVLAWLASQHVSADVLPAWAAALEDVGGTAVRTFEQGHAQAPSLHGPAPPDSVVVTVLSVFAMVGLLTSRSDVCELIAEQEANMAKKQSPDKKKKAAPLADRSGTGDPSSIGIAALPMVLRLALQTAVLLNAILFAALWVQGDLGSAFAPEWRAGFVQLASPLASDEVTVASTGIFVLLGIAIMCVDFRALASEEKETASKTVFASADVKCGHQSSWRQTLHWRLVSCVVLLLSMFVAAAAMLWEGEM